MLSLSVRPKAWPFSVDNEVSIKVLKQIWGVPLRISYGDRGEQFDGSGKSWVGLGEGKVGGQEGTDVGQTWVDQRVQSSRSPGRRSCSGRPGVCSGVC